MWKNFPAPGVLELLFNWRVRILQGHYLTPGGWEILSHPPYSPDLAPRKKKHFRGQHFHCPGCIFFCEGPDKLIYQYDECINRLGDYVEK
jgi:hypothetical protein